MLCLSKYYINSETLVINGLDNELISNATGLTIEKINELRNETDN